MATLPTSLLTEEQYLTIERAAEFKSEFHDGQLFALAGASPTHALLTGNMIGLLHRQLPAGCRTFSSDLRIKVGSGRLYTYPDCSVDISLAELYASATDLG